MKLIELTVKGRVDSNLESFPELNAEVAQKCDEAIVAARALVAALVVAGVEVHVGALAIFPHEGTHEAVEVTDLTAV
jgi:hypothetical protein